MRWSVLLLLPVALGVFVALQPHHLLKLPMGFIPWAILGNPMPPFFNYEVYEPKYFSQWVRPGDVIVTPGAKSGTTWLLYMTHLIRTKADPNAEPWIDPMINTPWTLLRHRPTQTTQQVIDELNTTILEDGSKLKSHWDHPDYPFRVWKAHETPTTSEPKLLTSALPVREHRDIKYIACIRPAPDVAASLYPFFGNHRQEVRDVWGGFPPVYNSPDETFADLMPGGALDVLLTPYAQAWWQHRNDPNVLLLSYNHMARSDANRRAIVVQVAKFVGVELTEEQVDRITHLTSFKEMKKIGDRFNYIAWGSKDIPALLQSGKLINKGSTGRGKALFSPEQVQAITEYERSLLSQDALDFVYDTKKE